MFGLVPAFVRSDALFWAGGNLLDDVFETKFGIDFLQLSGVVNAFLKDLVLGAENVTIVLR